MGDGCESCAGPRPGAGEWGAGGGGLQGLPAGRLDGACRCRLPWPGACGLCSGALKPDLASPPWASLLPAPGLSRTPTARLLLCSLPCSTRGTSAWEAGRSCAWGHRPTRSRRAGPEPEWLLRAPARGPAKTQARALHPDRSQAVGGHLRAELGWAVMDPVLPEPGAAPARPRCLRTGTSSRSTQWPVGHPQGPIRKSLSSTLTTRDSCP